MLNFIFTFPEVPTLGDLIVLIHPRDVYNNIIEFDAPTFHRPDKDGFLGWEIQNIQGDIIDLIDIDLPLKKGNRVQFNATSIDLWAKDYYTTISCKMKWMEGLNVRLMWQDIGAQTMTATFNLKNIQPKATYLDDAVNMITGSNQWDEFFGHYPVLLKNGIEICRLDPNDYSRDIQGNSVDIESGEMGDVMIAFPKRGLRISKDENNILTISFTASDNSTDHEYYAHPHDKFYISAYDGYIDETGRLRSLSGKTPTMNQTIATYRQSAQLNGSGYEQLSFYQLTYLQALYAIKYGCFAVSETLGRGENSTDANIQTGTLNRVGLDYGDPTQYSSPVKFVGIEHFYGNATVFVDGLVTDENCNYLITDTNFNDNGIGYKIKITPNYNRPFAGIAEDCAGTSEGGFVATKHTGGTDNVYLASMISVNKSSIAMFSDRMFGIFCSLPPTATRSHITGKLIKI